MPDIPIHTDGQMPILAVLGAHLKKKVCWPQQRFVTNEGLILRFNHIWGIHIVYSYERTISRIKTLTHFVHVKE